jgi:hypothetical protein
LTRSAEALEKKRVGLFVGAKKCKRVRKDLKRKNLNTVESSRRQPALAVPKWEEYPHTPGVFVRVANRGLAGYGTWKKIRKMGDREARG